jgi:hypothetical protein
MESLFESKYKCNIENDSLKPRDGVERMLGLEVPYLSAIWPTPTQLLGIKNIFRNLYGTTHYLTYSCELREIWTPISSEYTNVGYLNDPHNVYLHGISVTPLMSLKQTLMTTPTNHSEIQSHVTRVALWNDKPHT